MFELMVYKIKININILILIIIMTWMVLMVSTISTSTSNTNSISNTKLLKTNHNCDQHQHINSNTNNMNTFDNCNDNDDLNDNSRTTTTTTTTTTTLDEFYIEHEISALDARLSAARLHPELMEIPSGCKTCSSAEIRYCLGPSLMNDHCCCDRRFQETLHHIPHTCYIGQRLCRTIARDCGQYARLRACCCDQHTAYKWKALSNGATTTNTIISTSTTIININYYIPISNILLTVIVLSTI